MKILAIVLNVKNSVRQKTNTRRNLFQIVYLLRIKMAYFAYFHMEATPIVQIDFFPASSLLPMHAHKTLKRCFEMHAAVIVRDESGSPLNRKFCVS